MIYKQLGNCTNVSNICFGTANLFDKDKKISTKQSLRLLKCCTENGINFFDTADEYGKGRVEKLLGNFIKREKKKIYVSTKIGQLYGFSKNKIQKAVDNSLKRLNLDSIDFLFFHSGSNREFLNDDLWNILNKNKDSGKIKNLGLSLKTSYLINNDNLQIQKASDYNVKIINLAYNPFFPFAKKIFNNPKKSKYEFISRLAFSSGLVFKAKREEKFKKYFGKKNLDNLLRFKVKNLSNDFIAKKIIKNILKEKKIKSCIIGASKIKQLKLLESFK